MTLTKASIVDAIHQELGFPKNRSAELLELLLELMKNKLQNNENVLISGFGKFCVKQKKQRRGRNPATGVPYFHLPALGWGNGWATGNVLRFNTIGAQFPVWVVRTVQQGPESVPDDNFTLLIRGDVDTP